MIRRLPCSPPPAVLRYAAHDAFTNCCAHAANIVPSQLVVCQLLQSNYATRACSLHAPDMLFHSRGAFFASELCQKPRLRKPFQKRVERREAPGRGPRHADGCCHPATFRAWRAPQKIRLREPPASGALRLPALHHHRGSPPRLSTAAARAPLPFRGRPASSTGVLTVNGKIRFHNGNIGLLSSINSHCA